LHKSYAKKHNREYDDDDDEWIFDPSLDAIITGGGIAKKGPLLDFQLRPVGACRNWRNVLNKRFEATLLQNRDATKTTISGLK